jgi:hypothetical protein
MKNFDLNLTVSVGAALLIALIGANLLRTDPDSFFIRAIVAAGTFVAGYLVLSAIKSPIWHGRKQPTLAESIRSQFGRNVH